MTQLTKRDKSLYCQNCNVPLSKRETIRIEQTAQRYGMDLNNVSQLCDDCERAHDDANEMDLDFANDYFYDN